MEVRRLSLLEGAKKAQGLCVVIDVFRAFTTAAVALAQGAEAVVPVATVEEALRLRGENPGWLVMGERGGVKVSGFDYGNSPAELLGLDLSGRTLIQTTSAGTQGLYAAAQCHEVLAGAFVTAEATVEYIQGRRPRCVSLVAMGWGGVEPSPEDESLVDYLEQRLGGLRPDFAEMERRIRAHPQGAKFFDPHQPHFTEADYHLAMDLDRYSFCLRLERGNPPRLMAITP